METFNFRLDRETREKLDLIASRYRRSRADVIRLMIEDEVLKDEKSWTQSPDSKTSGSSGKEREGSQGGHSKWLTIKKVN